MRRRSSSKRHYFRGGDIKIVQSVDDLYNSDSNYDRRFVIEGYLSKLTDEEKEIIYANKYELLINDTRFFIEGYLSKLTDEEKKNLFDKYANNNDYTFYVA